MDEEPQPYPHKIVSLAVKGSMFVITYEDEKRERSQVKVRMASDGLV